MLLKQVIGSVIAPALVALSAPTLTTDLLKPATHHSLLLFHANNNNGDPRTATTTTTKSPTQDYLPRKLYPASYGNYCGPTPEVDRGSGCVAHGWHGDKPVDAVDDACRLHDVSYCQCESQLLQRRDNDGDSSSIPMLSALTALRFVARPVLPVDDEYYQCINRADRQLIVRGLEIRGEQQRTACATDPALAWFCRVGGKGKQQDGLTDKDTLGAFEKVSLAIFLKSLDDDEAKSLQQERHTKWTLSQLWQQPANAAPTTSGGSTASSSSSSISLTALEKQRRIHLKQELSKGKSLVEAAASPVVVRTEQEMIRRLNINSARTANEKGPE